MTLWRTLAVVSALSLAPLSLHAADCPDLGLPADTAQGYCQQFRDLLYAPHSPNTDRDYSKEDADKIEAILNSDPLWGEVFRSDPKQTLALIDRIRNSGGLRVE